jgi:hypothetical protein
MNYESRGSFFVEMTLFLPRRIEAVAEYLVLTKSESNAIILM